MRCVNQAAVLAFTCGLSAACSDLAVGTKKDGEACNKMEECEGNLICSDGRCTPPCNRDDECGEGRFCNNGLCVSSECGNGLREGKEECDAGLQNADSTACTTECKLNVCGDEKQYAGVEECDDGSRNSDTSPDACRTSCRLPYCGDAVEDLGEACDDGYTDACGSCNADCSDAGSGAVCGDGIRCPELEACDDGYADACGSCNADCSGAGGGPGVCGDGAQCPEAGEACDDGYTDACGSCNADCSDVGESAVCGDGERCPELEACDDGYADTCGSCNADCSDAGSGAVCGDGERCPELEFCDDGYTDTCGSCNADCSDAGSGPGVCGDGAQCPEAGEACDDGYTDACGSCNADCSDAGSDAVCGDGIRCPELEACDDGYTDACGSCNADCSDAGSGAVCGDGARCPELEACDDGYTDACGSCNADCSDAGSGPGVCGDGAQCPEAGEACDDGYTDACGSCNADCSDAGSDAVCGDGARCPEYEACDDGNTIPGDDCTAWCSGDTGCGDASCNSNGPRFPVAGEPQFSGTAGAEPVVTDGRTGLMWQACPAGLSDSACSTGSAATMVWGDAVSYCIDLIWNGLADWYLPDEYELQTLVDYSVYDPAIDSGTFSATPSELFWTSSSFASSTVYAWYVDFNLGVVNGYNKGNACLVRCVRREAFFPVASGRFVRASGSQPVVRDTATGLIWQGCEAGRSGDSCETGTSEQRIWADAVAYCDTLEWAGVSDWYLPGAQELRSIVDNRRAGPSVDVAAFPATTDTGFWTSSSRAGDAGVAWRVHFNDGFLSILLKSLSNNVRCVRGGP